MAEIRKFDPSDGEGLQKLVREALGETTRPVTPGEPKPTESAAEPRNADDDASEASAAAQVPNHFLFGTGGPAGAGGGSW
ncbi:hypothetical protein GCM10025789_13490 [Tessaracoccus lubricantis]|uniref:Uncharacterized protein n=1 Tax=Tessaracoccus lubricantis TaxID=545543 RepID=A0ABP9FIM1_9ACTN